MDSSSQNRRFWQVMIGLFLLIFGIATLTSGSASFMPIMLALAGFYLLARQMDRTARNYHRTAPVRKERVAAAAPPRAQTSGAEQVYAHAIEAVHRAGRDPGETRVLPVDIGVMAYRAGTDPTIHRSQPVYDDVDYVQPFVQLRLPRRATGRIRFEIVDSDGQTLFIHEDYHHLERGRNLVTPAARLPVHDAQVTSSDWELRVSADGVLLADHRFGWRERTEKVVRRHMREDGEITSELRAAIIENEPADMSLEDLLALQEEGQQAARG